MDKEHEGKSKTGAKHFLIRNKNLEGTVRR